MRGNHHWTERDLDTLRSMFRAGRTDAEIAATIGSTPGSTTKVRCHLRLYRGGEVCAWCEAPLQHPAVGRRKTWCDELCRDAHRAERDSAARRAPYLAGKLRCQHCAEPLRPFQRKYCSRACSQAAWHLAVFSDSKRWARRRAMLKTNRLARAAVVA